MPTCCHGEWPPNPSWKPDLRSAYGQFNKKPRWGCWGHCRRLLADIIGCRPPPLACICLVSHEHADLTLVPRSLWPGPRPSHSAWWTWRKVALAPIPQARASLWTRCTPG